MMRFKVWRSGKDGDDARYDTFEVQPVKGMNVLEALFEIQDRLDDTLAFRYACRGAVCGSCAMMINREIRLACRTQVSLISHYKPMGLKPFPPLQSPVDWDRDSEVLVEPLPNLPIQKDLVVDMTRFYRYYERVKPYLETLEEVGAPTRIMPQQMERAERLANCILCAACYGSCPVCHKNSRYIGPHALAWSLRFIDDPRAKGDEQERLSLVKDQDGVPACEWFYNCVRTCPKDVAPAAAIKILKEKLAQRKLI